MPRSTALPLHSYHLAEVPAHVGARALARHAVRAARGRAPEVPGLQHLEVLAQMRLGAPAVSPERLQPTRLAVLAQWRDEAALDAFLTDDPLGRRLAGGWHVRLEFVRRWGLVSGLELPLNAGTLAPDEPVAAVTLAHLRPRELPRFFRWGRPVEELVRDDAGQTLALAAVRPPGTFSTFSIWHSLEAMRAMVEGRGAGHTQQRHAHAMAERERRDFHREFTTLRFRPLSEHGSWRGCQDLVPTR